MSVFRFAGTGRTLAHHAVRTVFIAAGCLGLASQAQAPGEAGPRLHRSTSAPGAADATHGPARVIVRFKAAAGSDGRTQILSASTGPTNGPARAAALTARHGLALQDGRAIDPRTQVIRASSMSSAALAARLAVDPEVEFAEVDRPVRAYAAPNDPLYPAGQTGAMPAVGQWYLRAPTSTAPAAINAEGAWDITTGSATVVVAVIDTGVRTDHPDLAGKLLPGYDFISDAAVANDNDGRDGDPSDPGDWVSSSDVASGNLGGCTARDIGNSSWHGTQTSGIVGAATNNGVGMAGTGRNVMVLPVRVLGKCGGYQSDVLAAMQWAAGLTVAGVPANPNPAKVINLSLGATGACGASYQATVTDLKNRGITVVAAAGNDGLAVDAPANCIGAIGVAGVRHIGTKVGYSNLGPEVAVAAPAGNCVNTSGACLYPIVTTINTGTQGPSTNGYSDAFSASVGTSFSSPQVAAAAALMLAVNPQLTPDQIRSLMTTTARPFPTTGATGGISACTAPSTTAQDTECYCTTSTCGAGMLDVSAAVAAAAVGRTVARLDVTSAKVNLGASVTLDGSNSRSANGSLTYAWAVTSTDTATGTFTTSTNAPLATLTLAGNGTVTVALTVTDGSGNQAVASARYTVGAAPQPAAPDSGGDGGGSIDLAWLLIAGLAAGGAAWQRRRNGA